MPFFFEFSASTGVSSSAEAFLTLANSSARSRCAPAAASDLQLFASTSLAVMSCWRVPAFYSSASGRERWRLSRASSGRFTGVVMCVNTLWQLWGWGVVLVDKTSL